MQSLLLLLLLPFTFRVFLYAFSSSSSSSSSSFIFTTTTNNCINPVSAFQIISISSSSLRQRFNKDDTYYYIHEKTKRRRRRRRRRNIFLLQVVVVPPVSATLDESLLLTHTTTTTNQTVAASVAEVLLLESDNTTAPFPQLHTLVVPSPTIVKIPNKNDKTTTVNTIMIIDVENVRGFNGFVYNHSQLLHLLQLYIQKQQQATTVSKKSLLLVIDHGNVPSSYYVPLTSKTTDIDNNNNNGYAIVFAGPHCKADDTIVHDVIPYLLTTLNDESDNDTTTTTTTETTTTTALPQCKVQVITADRMLISRCHRAVREYYKCRDTISGVSSSSNNSNNAKKAKTKKGYDMEISNNNSNKHIRLEIVSPKVLLTDLVRLNASLKVIDDDIKQDIFPDDDVVVVGLSSQKNRYKNNISARSRKLRSSRTYIKKETTEDRIILAEALRLELEQQQLLPTQQQDNNNNNSDENWTHHYISPAQSYVLYKHRNLNKNQATATTNTIPTAIETTTSTIHNGFIQNYHMNEDQTSSSNAEVKDFSTTFVSSSSSDSSKLRLVVVSDTHGFEDQLPSPLPDGDILIHLGDFAMDTIVMNTAGGKQRRRSRHDNSQLKNFDAWLAQQSARIKIVVRGNHDPRSLSFVKSGATYVTQPTVMEIGGYTFAIVPFQSSTKNGLRHKGSIPKTGCDVILSHVPPYSLLDRCHTGKLAGSNTLLKGAQSINGKDGPPVLWLCGHIHESRGILQDVLLTKNKSNSNMITYSTTTSTMMGTTIINAACANLGHAKYMQYGPTVLDLMCHTKSPAEKVHDDVINNNNNNYHRKVSQKVNVIHMDGRFEYLNSKYPYFFQPDSGTDLSSNNGNLLLAIDLGLRTGISLFDRSENGRLIRYNHFDYDSISALEIGAVQLLEEWESERNTRSHNNNENSNSTMIHHHHHHRITHIAIEGSDPPLIDVWKRVIQQHQQTISHHLQSATKLETMDNNSTPIKIKMLLVSPNEWRSDLLTRKERTSGESSKLASRRIAQDIICSSSSYTHPSPTSLKLPPPSLEDDINDISTDVAESILLGYHIIRRLGWCDFFGP